MGILVTSALVALSVVSLQPSSVVRTVATIAPKAVSGTIPACSGAAESDYNCYQQRYQRLVNGPGVKTAFDVLKDEYETNQFVRGSCHQLTHVIGRAATDVYGDLASTYGQGDNFCWSGYYHGAMEALVARIGPDNIVDEANEICADMGEHQKYSFYHYNCVHGLGHGFMGVQENELFESLEACDTLIDDWEQRSCYGGVFMENIMAKDNPSHPSKYLKTDEPMYPCTDVEDRYKEECYKMQTSHTLETQGGDFAKVFALCGEAEEDFRATCYQSLGRDASGKSVSNAELTRSTCMLGEDDEARSNCVVGAVKDFISYYHSDAQARELCDSLDPDLRDLCLDTAEEYYRTFQA